MNILTILNYIYYMINIGIRKGTFIMEIKKVCLEVDYFYEKILLTLTGMIMEKHTGYYFVNIDKVRRLIFDLQLVEEKCLDISIAYENRSEGEKEYIFEDKIKDMHSLTMLFNNSLLLDVPNEEFKVSISFKILDENYSTDSKCEIVIDSAESIESLKDYVKNLDLNDEANMYSLVCGCLEYIYGKETDKKEDRIKNIENISDLIILLHRKLEYLGYYKEDYSEGYLYCDTKGKINKLYRLGKKKKISNILYRFLSLTDSIRLKVKPNEDILTEKRISFWIVDKGILE